MLSRLFGPGISGQRIATILQVGERGDVTVTLGGQEGSQRAESGLRLYDGDRVTTAEGSRAQLQFFEGSRIILDGRTVLELQEVLAGEESSLLSVKLLEGRALLLTGTSGTVLRILDTPLVQYLVPPRTRAIVEVPRGNEGEEEGLYVFATSGPGVEMTIRKSGRTPAMVVVGEGQQLRLSRVAAERIREGEMNPYDVRGILEEHIFDLEFYQSSFEEPTSAPSEETAEETLIEGKHLLVDTPEDGSLLPGTSVSVRGRAAPQVTAIRVNGYAALLEDGAFEKEIALPEEEAFTIEVVAEDKDGLVIATKTLSLSRDIRPPDPPTIVSPGSSGATVQVSEDSFEIIGESSPDATGIIVNGYQLQKFRPGQPWRYLVDPALGNVRIGENTYEVVAIDRVGNRSVPVRITIVWKAQPYVPVVPSQDRTTGPSEERILLLPGSLRVTAPSQESPYVTDASEVLLEGETAPETVSISVNGFTLTKYLAGKTTWNYIAKEEFGNYRKGVNLYTIVARNAAGQILDVLRYTIERK
jgi:hypothetical protein